jgi:hypothetical protein
MLGVIAAPLKAFREALARLSNEDKKFALGDPRTTSIS